MIKPGKCSHCGASLPASAPRGMCVRCLLGVGLDKAEEGESAGTAHAGTARFGDYELLDKGREGGMGKVYHARQSSLNRIVALKVIRAGAFASTKDVRRFHDEAEAAAGLDHSHIVPIIEVGECDGRDFFTMKWMEGGSLADALQRDMALVAEGKPRFFTAEKAVALLVPVVRAVYHAHQRGIIHRDLKPSNILLDQEGQLHVSDFGLAKRVTNRELEICDPEPTQSGAAVGTPAYMAPEQARGKARDVTVVADVYALGAILYEVLCGRPPFVGDTPLEIMRKVVDELPKRPSIVVPRIDSDLETICLKCLEKEPTHRFSTALALAEDLERWLRHEPIEARPPSATYRFKRLVRRNRITFAAATAVLFALMFSAFSFLREAATRQQEAATRQVSELGKAELASRTGQWENSLIHLESAERSGYRDAIDLGLKRAEAWTVLHDRAKAAAEFKKLIQLPDLGARRGAVLLHIGEFQMFDRDTFQQGVQRVREALTNGLSASDKWLAEGLLTDSTTNALASFRRALELDPYLHSAHRHSLGLAFVLGRHDELASQLRVAKAFYPGDFSPGAIEVAELALQGRLPDAQAALATYKGSISPETNIRLERGIRFLAKAVEYFDVESYLGERTNTVSKTELVTEATQIFLARDMGDATNATRNALPPLPCLEQGIRTAFEGLQSLAMARILGGTDRIDNALERVRAGYRHHPEALFPTFAGVLIDSWQPRTGPRDLWLLTVQSEMYQLGSDSPSILPNLRRLSRLLAVDVQEELARSTRTNALVFRTNCVANLRVAALDPHLTPIECRGYSRWSHSLGELDLNRQFLARWEALRPGDTNLLRHRIRLEMASRAYGPALDLTQRALEINPDDKLAQAERAKALREISKLNTWASGLKP